jgi:predicted metal-dependent phosphoesterase TrpH
VHSQNLVDLHIHSTASDGVSSPSEVVFVAIQQGLGVIALTDHDTLGGVAEAQAAAKETGLEVIAGVEINSAGGGVAIHILGFYVDPQNPLLNEKLQTMRDSRLDRARRMIERLDEMGMAVDWDRVQELASGETVGRPHVAWALVERGYVSSVREAFERFIGPTGPAHVSRLRLTPKETIEMILHAGGVPVLAHPAHSGPTATARITEFVEYGLCGLEVYYPHHSPEDVAMLEEMCRELGLVATGGSDFHGPNSSEGAALGSIHVPLECAERLREAAATHGAGPAAGPRG